MTPSAICSLTTIPDVQLGSHLLKLIVLCCAADGYFVFIMQLGFAMVRHLSSSYFCTPLT